MCRPYLEIMEIIAYLFKEKKVKIIKMIANSYFFFFLATESDLAQTELVNIIQTCIGGLCPTVAGDTGGDGDGTHTVITGTVASWQL